MAFAVAMKEWLTVTTSSPGPTPSASSARCNAVVQLETAHACDAPTASANSCSNAATSGPCVTHPDKMARRAAAASCSSIHGRATGMIVFTGSPATVITTSERATDHEPLTTHRIDVPVSDHFIAKQLLGRHVLRLVPVEQLSQPLFQPHLRCIPEERLRVRHIRAQPQYVAWARLLMHDLRVWGVRDLRDRARQLIHRQLEPTPQIQRPTDRRRRCCREDDAARRIADIGEVTCLRSITEHDHRLAGETSQHELRDHFAAVPFVMTARSVGVERTDDD